MNTKQIFQEKIYFLFPNALHPELDSLVPLISLKYLWIPWKFMKKPKIWWRLPVNICFLQFSFPLGIIQPTKGNGDLEEKLFFSHLLSYVIQRVEGASPCLCCSWSYTSTHWPLSCENYIIYFSLPPPSRF